MAHYDPQEQISQADLYLLQSFREANFETVLATTALSGSVKHEQFWNQVSPYVDCLITRPNEGFDFGSWAVAINELELSNRVSGRLILINNSMFGPFQSMTEVLEDWSPNCDVYGITSSNEFCRHVQSYFLGFQSVVLKSEVFQRYWNTDFRETNKWLTIFRFEMQWSKYFSSSGYQICIRHEAPRKFLRNPLTFRWYELLAEDMPFVKKSLFNQNYDRIEMTTSLEKLKSLKTKFPLEYIESYMNSSLRK